MFYINHSYIYRSVVSEIFNDEKYRYLEIPVKSQTRSLKWYHSIDRAGTVSY